MVCVCVCILCQDWEDRYLHPNWSTAAEPDTEVEMVSQVLYNVVSAQECMPDCQSATLMY